MPEQKYIFFGVFIILFFSLCVLFAQSSDVIQTSDELKYYCPPCGCKYDHQFFNEPGNCPDADYCNMKLLQVKGNTHKITLWKKFVQNSWLIRLYDIVMLPAAIQGFIFGFILIFSTKNNKMANRFLATLIFAISLHSLKYSYIAPIIGDYLHNVGANPENNFQTLSIPLSFILLIPPCLYFYACSITNIRYRLYKKDYLHFLPALFVFIVYNFLYWSLPANTQQGHASYAGFYLYFNLFEQLAAIVSGFVYVYQIFQLLKKHQIWVYDNFSNTQRKSMKWLKGMMISLTVIWFFWFMVTIANLPDYDFVIQYLFVFPLQIVLSVVILWIGYVGFIQAEIFSVELSFNQDVPLKEKEEELPQTQENTTVSNPALTQALLNDMEQQQLYLNPNLTLSTLANTLGISSRQLSQTLNADLQKNFHDFVNEYRVEEVKKRLVSKQYQHLTILAVAFDSGFNSKSTFNRIFMKFTGISPKDYREQHILS